jgi:hypothetical protein
MAEKNKTPAYLPNMPIEKDLETKLEKYKEATGASTTGAVRIALTEFLDAWAKQNKVA